MLQASCPRCAPVAGSARCKAQTEHGESRGAGARLGAGQPAPGNPRGREGARTGPSRGRGVSPSAARNAGGSPEHRRDPAPRPPPLKRARQALPAARPLLTAALPNPCEGGAKPRPEAPGSQSTPAKGGDGAGCDHPLSFPRATPHEPEGSRRR